LGTTQVRMPSLPPFLLPFPPPPALRQPILPSALPPSLRPATAWTTSSFLPGPPPLRISSA
jgi:hypothetical protein